MPKFFLYICFTVLVYSDGLGYLNALRTSAGLPVLTEQSNLATAARNHSAYMQANNIFSHEENNNRTDFTGVKSSDRAIYAGYKHKLVSENISMGQDSMESSIDGLMSAIYHRFGFLSLDSDEIGMAVSDNGKYYTYNLGNSKLSDLCMNGPFSSSGSYYTPCADEKIKIKASDYIARSKNIQESSAEIIMWPASGSENIPPVFYEEIPDPLPSASVSGYPVSVQFNETYYPADPVRVNDFNLSSKNGTRLDTLILMNKENDPNHRFSSNEFAIFPKQRLEWGSIYNVDLSYNYKDENSEKHWCFATRSLSDIADRFYRIEDNKEISLEVLAEKKYALYIVPDDNNDILGGLSWAYSADKVSLKSVDNNTILAKVSGAKGTYVEIKFDNGQKIKLTIGSTDSAEAPKAQSCPTTTQIPQNNTNYPEQNTTKDNPVDTDHDSIPDEKDLDDDNDGIPDTVERTLGLDPLNALDAQKDFDHDGFTNLVEISVGSDIYNEHSKPKWVTIIVNDIVTLVPYY